MKKGKKIFLFLSGKLVGTFYHVTSYEVSKVGICIEVEGKQVFVSSCSYCKLKENNEGSCIIPGTSWSIND